MTQRNMQDFMHDQVPRPIHDKKATSAFMSIYIGHEPRLMNTHAVESELYKL